jgi:hypothetical protein
MKQKIETKKDGKDFARFDDLLRNVVKVPKDEILRREKAEKKRKAKEKETV